MKRRPVIIVLGALGLWALWWGSCQAITYLSQPPMRYVGQGNNRVGIQDLSPGSGPGAETGGTIEVRYTGELTNGTVFDSTEKQGGAPLSVKLGTSEVIRGWDIGLVGIRPGGKRRLTVPPALAYPEGRPQSGIPPNSTLVFEVERVK